MKFWFRIHLQIFTFLSNNLILVIFKKFLFQARLDVNDYHLRAVVVHYGNQVKSGHYSTYARVGKRCMATLEFGNKESTEWLCFNDREVRNVSVAEAMRQHAYMLFYERTTNIQ